MRKVFSNKELKVPKGREAIMGHCYQCGDVQQIDMFEYWNESNNRFYCDCLNKNKEAGEQLQ